MRHSYAGDANRRFNGGGNGAVVIVAIAILVWAVCKMLGI